MKKIACTLGLLVVIILAGCNLPATPTPSSNTAFTQAAQTVEAELTRMAGLASPTPSLPPATLTPIPSATLLPSTTNTPIPCNLALFITDVTVPDNTVISPGQAFTKTWRLRNIGSCTWTSSYQLVFTHGDPLGVVTGYAQAMTSGMISPGQDVDVSVNLTAPLTSSTYKGYWGFREPGGTIFANFVVVIKVPAPTSHSLNVNSIASEGGAVRSDGTVLTGIPNVGDTVSNAGSEVFISFDISGIPTNATITQVQMDLTGYDILGDPFAHLGCFRAYQQNYVIPLGPSAYVPGPAPAGEDHDWCATADVNAVQADNDFKNALQAKLGSSNRLQYRLQFTTVTNSDNLDDMVRFTGPKLVVTYTTP